VSKSLSPHDLGFGARDRHRLQKALGAVREARLFRRVQAVWLAAKGKQLAEVAEITALSVRSVYRVVKRYLKSRRIEDLTDKPRPGRPPEAPGLTRAKILRELRRSRLRLGYRTNVWTVAILAHRLNERYQCDIGPWALRQRMRQIGLTCKRPRYFYSQRAAHVAQKKGGHRAENAGHAGQCRVAL